MKPAAAILCLLLSFIALLDSTHASGVLQDAPASRSQPTCELPFAAGFLLLGVAGILLIIWHVRQRRGSP